MLLGAGFLPTFYPQRGRRCVSQYVSRTCSDVRVGLESHPQTSLIPLEIVCRENLRPPLQAAHEKSGKSRFYINQIVRSFCCAN